MIDVYGRDWYNVSPSELCSECGQPDNCGDCTHGRLSDADYRFLNNCED